MPDAPFLADYQALTAGAGLVYFGDRTLVELTGEDRAKFLHNFCTADIVRLQPGQGTEAFITSVQGKTLAHLLVFSGPKSIVLETVPGQAEKIIGHLDRYLLRDQVELVDRSLEWSEWLLAGAASQALLAGLTGGVLPTEMLSSVQTEILGSEVWLRRVDLAGPVGFLIDCQRVQAAAIGHYLVEAGAKAVGHAALEAVRIEAGFPWFGLDLGDQNLPQEIGRDTRAISFRKGCYLGQETVARLDALGHVNKSLVGLRFSGDTVPEPGSELTLGGAASGQVTSACWSPRLSAPLALGYARRGSNTPGSPHESHFGPVAVVPLPIAADSDFPAN